MDRRDDADVAPRAAGHTAGGRLWRAQRLSTRIRTAWNADSARIGRVRGTLGTVSFGGSVVSVARRRPASRRQTTQARHADTHQDREEKNRQEGRDKTKARP